MNDFDILSTDQVLQLQESSDRNDIEQIINIFNLNLKKKELLRVSKLSDLQDSITDQVEQRLKKHADEFSNRDLIDYFKAFQETITKTNKTADEIPHVQITQNQLNINVQPEYNLDERQRILNTVRQIIAESNRPEQIVFNDQLEVVDETESNV